MGPTGPMFPYPLPLFTPCLAQRLTIIPTSTMKSEGMSARMGGCSGGEGNRLSGKYQNRSNVKGGLLYIRQNKQDFGWEKEKKKRIQIKKKVYSVSCCHQLRHTDGVRLSYLPYSTLGGKHITALFYKEAEQQCVCMCVCVCEMIPTDCHLPPNMRSP